MSSLFSPIVEAGVDCDPRHKLDGPVKPTPINDHGIISVWSLPETPIALGANSPIVTFRPITLQYRATVTYCRIVCAPKGLLILSQWHIKIPTQAGKPTNVSRRRYSISDPGIPTESGQNNRYDILRCARQCLFDERYTGPLV
jgi:hypothetical protein